LLSKNTGREGGGGKGKRRRVVANIGGKIRKGQGKKRMITSRFSPRKKRALSYLLAGEEREYRRCNKRGEKKRGRLHLFRFLKREKRGTMRSRTFSKQ